MKTRIRIEAALAVLLAALPLIGPAFAQAAPNGSVKAVLEKGAVFVADGRNYEFVAKPDGSYADTVGAAQGTYRADGASLCITPNIYGREACFTFPDGKKSGDKFDVVNQFGQTAAVTIR
jgi:hypothetical protein